MPDCRLCKTHFPVKMSIDGKIRNLSKRKYCLKCSPFGWKNTKRLTMVLEAKKQGRSSSVSICTMCGREFLAKSGRKKCPSCALDPERRVRVKQRAIEYKGGKCTLCGYKTHNSALEFHHKDPSQKDFGLGSSYFYAWERIRVELDKCVLLCANCHREVHAGLATI